MFRQILTALFTVLQLYVFWRAGSVPALKRRIPRWMLSVTGLTLWGIFVLGLHLGHNGAGTAAAAVELVGMTWMAVLFLLFACLIAVDVATGFGILFPRTAPVLRGWALVAGGALSAIALAQGLRPPVVIDYEVRLSGLPGEMDGTTIVALSDLHLGTLLGEKWLSARVEQVRKLCPELVVLLGDTFEGHGQVPEVLPPIFRRLSAPLGLWAVLGNHESYGRDHAGEELVAEGGFRLLHDSWAEIKPGLVLAGVDYIGGGLRSVRRTGDPFGKALAGRPPGATILLTHAPPRREEVEGKGVGLVLSGHTHAGQVWPFSYFVRPRYEFFEGKHEKDGLTVIVSRGTGTWGPRMRLWRPGEILRITLRP